MSLSFSVVEQLRTQRQAGSACLSTNVSTLCGHWEVPTYSEPMGQKSRPTVALSMVNSTATIVAAPKSHYQVSALSSPIPQFIYKIIGQVFGMADSQRGNKVTIGCAEKTGDNGPEGLGRGGHPARPANRILGRSRGILKSGRGRIDAVDARYLLAIRRKP